MRVRVCACACLYVVCVLALRSSACVCAFVCVVPSCCRWHLCERHNWALVLATCVRHGTERRSGGSASDEESVTTHGARCRTVEGGPPTNTKKSGPLDYVEQPASVEAFEFQDGCHSLRCSRRYQIHSCCSMEISGAWHHHRSCIALLPVLLDIRVSQ